jgi:hypothetical protein
VAAVLGAGSPCWVAELRCWAAPLANPAGESGRLGLAGRARGVGVTGGVVAGRESLHRRNGDQGDIDVLQLQTHRQTCRQRGRRDPFLGNRIPVLREQLVEPVVSCGEPLVGANDPMGSQTAGFGHRSTHTPILPSAKANISRHLPVLPAAARVNVSPSHRRQRRVTPM